MWTTFFYKSFFQKYFVAHEQSAVKNSFSTYLCYAPDGLFWLNLYMTSFPEVQLSSENTTLSYTKVQDFHIPIDYFAINI